MLFTPILISISISVGLLSFIMSINYLFNCITLNTNEVDIYKCEISNSDIRIIKRGAYIESIHYDSLSYYSGIRNSDKTSFIKSLKDVNKRAYLNINPIVFRWILFVSVALSISNASSIFIFLLVYQLYEKYKHYFTKKSWLSLILSLLALLAFFLYVWCNKSVFLDGGQIMDDFNIIFSNPSKSTYLVTGCLLFISLAPIIGILIINLATYFTLQLNEENKSELHLNIEYIYLNDRINILAFYLGVLVSFAVIGSGLQRNMIISQIVDLEILYPIEMTYAYGISYSLILALFFIPSSLYLRYLGQELSTEDDDQGKGKWWQLGQETYTTLKLGLAIALPFITSVIQPMLS